jgi:hypothetical protein
MAQGRSTGSGFSRDGLLKHGTIDQPDAAVGVACLYWRQDTLGIIAHRMSETPMQQTNGIVRVSLMRRTVFQRCQGYRAA